MDKAKNRKVLIWLLVILGVTVIPGALLADLFYRSDHGTTRSIVDVLENKWHRLTNYSTTKDYLIPNKTGMEFAALKNNLPADLSLDAIPCDYGGTEWQCGSDCSYQGHVYRTTQVGSQCWFADDLKETQYNSTNIPQWLGSETGYTNFINKFSCKDSDDDCPAGTESLLYQFGATLPNGCVPLGTAVGATGICPDGWHIPSEIEMSDFDTAVSSCEASAYLSADCLNSTFGLNFSLLGFRYFYDGAFYGAGSWNVIRSSGCVSGHTGNSHDLIYMTSDGQNTIPSTFGSPNYSNALPVRCIKGQGSI